uniref:Uncharacterized protein n=1 Tax=Quercus lobata TaxID=97700 RepID=A0A7N2L8N5_QUELO
MDNGRRHDSIFPSVGGRTPSRTMIFIRRLQKGRHVHRFSYEKPNLRGEKPSRCKLLLVPCWRHCLKSVITENSRIVVDKETLKAKETRLEKYFNENTEILESFQFLYGIVA